MVFSTSFYDNRDIPNFDTGILTVHDGKGKRDRSVPLPRQILPQLVAQIETVKQVHQQDMEVQYDGTFLFDLLEVKYKGAAKELCWQWFFQACRNDTKNKD